MICHLISFLAISFFSSTFAQVLSKLNEKKEERIFSLPHFNACDITFTNSNAFFPSKECPYGWDEFIGTASCYRFVRYPKANYDNAAALCQVGSDQ